MPEGGGEDDDPLAELLRDEGLDVVARLEHVQQGDLCSTAVRIERTYITQCHKVPAKFTSSTEIFFDNR